MRAVETRELADRLANLSKEEALALRGAATWYVKYHAGVIASAAGDTTAYAVEQRERYKLLVETLGKLGVRVPLPVEIASARERHAA